MADDEDVFMVCPYCKAVALQSLSDRALMEWMDYHINLRRCLEPS
jgi:hypothetical protein